LWDGGYSPPPGHHQGNHQGEKGIKKGIKSGLKGDYNPLVKWLHTSGIHKKGIKGIMFLTLFQLFLNFLV
jgi:hypothetical protein